MHSADHERALLLDALGERFLNDPRPISREPYGDGSIAGFETLEPASIAYADESATGEARTTWYVDTSGRSVKTETGLVLGDSAHPEARIWLHPADPRLPALAPASFEHSAQVLLERVGVELAAAPELIAYRPGKRAVFRMRGSDSASYLKVVRPEVVAELARVHTRLRDAGLPVPRVIAWGEIGLLVIAEAGGDPLTKHLGDFAPDQLLDAIDDVRARLGSVDLGRPARASLTQRSDWYIARILAGTNDSALREAARAIIDQLGAAPEPQRSQTIHGDLHCGQLFLRANTASDAPRIPVVTGLIDVDTAGTGDPVDDEAAFIGHLLATTAMRQSAGWPSASARTLAQAAWRRWNTAQGLRHAVLVHALGHALLPIERGDVELAAGILREALELVES